MNKIDLAFCLVLILHLLSMLFTELVKHTYSEPWQSFPKFYYTMCGKRSDHMCPFGQNIMHL